jgi:DNA-binding winged helix-turn-helix (wHTH) protein
VELKKSSGWWLNFPLKSVKVRIDSSGAAHNVLNGKHFYEFDDFRVEPEERIVVRSGKRVSLSGKPFDVLIALLKHPGRLVRKDQLISEVWPDAFVEEGNLSVQITAIRKALGKDYIEAVPKQGYRFVGKVTEKEGEPPPGGPRPRRRFAAIWGMALLSISVVALWIWIAGRNKVQTETAYSVSTDSADARSKYALAVRYEFEGDDEEALAALNEATGLDKNFADAYLRAAFISNQLGNDDQAQKYLDQAKGCGGTRNEHQRLRIDALDSELNEGYAEAIKRYRLLVDTFPRDVNDLYNFADLALRSRKEFSEASEALTRCLRIDPANPPCLFDRMWLHVLNNEFDKVISLHSSLKPSHYPWLDEPFGLALYGKGDLVGARDVLRTFSRQTHTHGTAMFTAGREWLADIDFFQGKINEGSSEIEVLQPNDSQFGATSHHLYLSTVNGMLSNRREALNLALKAVSETDDRDTRVEAASILACAGNVSEADRLLRLRNGEEIDDLLPETEMSITGCKALNQGDYKSAIRELQASYDISDDLDTEFFLARGYIGARQWDSAEAILEDLEASKGRIIADQSLPPVIWPLAHYYLAVVFDESGDSEKAILNYSRFVDLWQAADADLTVMVDSRKRLKELQASVRRNK